MNTDNRNNSLELILQAIQTGGSTDEAIREAAKGLTGHGYYTSTTGTVVAPIVTTAGNKTSLNFDNALFEDYLPFGATTLYSGGRIRPQSVGDTYEFRVGFFAASSSNNGAFSVEIDISPLGDGSDIVVKDSRRMIRGNGEYEFYTIPLPAFARDNFLANGGLVKMVAVDGNISIHSLTLLVTKTTAG